MIYIQKWKKHTFQYRFLNKVEEIFKNNINLDCYFGFDVGYFKGINIYYGSIKDSHAAFLLSKIFKEHNINVRLVTNIDYNFDLIVLFGYINNEKEKRCIKKNTGKILKALSLLLSFYK